MRVLAGGIVLVLLTGFVAADVEDLSAVDTLVSISPKESQFPSGPSPLLQGAVPVELLQESQGHSVGESAVSSGGSHRGSHRGRAAWLTRAAIRRRQNRIPLWKKTGFKPLTPKERHGLKLKFYRWRKKRLYKIMVNGPMTPRNIRQACWRFGLRPVCDSAKYRDHHCWSSGTNLHFSNPRHDNMNAMSFNLEHAKGVFWYTGAKGRGAILNTGAKGRGFRWRRASDIGGLTMCTSKVEELATVAQAGSAAGFIRRIERMTRRRRDVHHHRIKTCAKRCNWGCYLKRYKDLRRAFGNSKLKAARHWRRHGKKENRDCRCCRVSMRKVRASLAKRSSVVERLSKARILAKQRIPGSFHQTRNTPATRARERSYKQRAKRQAANRVAQRRRRRAAPVRVISEKKAVKKRVTIAKSVARDMDPHSAKNLATYNQKKVKVKKNGGISGRINCPALNPPPKKFSLTGKPGTTGVFALTKCIPTDFEIKATIKFKKNGSLPDKVLATLFGERKTIHVSYKHGVGKFVASVKLFPGDISISKSPMIKLKSPVLALMWSIEWGPALRITVPLDLGIMGTVLRLSAFIEFAPAFWSLGANLQGLWNKPLGIPGLAVANLNLQVWMTGTVPIGFAVGGVLGIGKDCGAVMRPLFRNKKRGETQISASDMKNMGKVMKGKQCLLGSLYVGIMAPPFFSFSFPRVMLVDILQFITMGKVNFGPIAKILATIGLPRGLSAWLDSIGGFGFDGTLSFMGWMGSAKINIRPKLQIFYANIMLPPVRLAGIIKLQRSKRDRRGPFLLMDIAVRRKRYNFDLTGYGKFLIFEAFVSVKFRKTGTQMVAQGPIMGGLFTGRIDFRAGWGSPSSAAVSYTAYLLPGPLSGLIPKIGKKITNIVTAGLRKLKAAFNAVFKVARKLGINIRLEKTSQQLWYERHEDLAEAAEKSEEGHQKLLACVREGCRAGSEWDHTHLDPSEGDKVVLYNKKTEAQAKKDIAHAHALIMDARSTIDLHGHENKDALLGLSSYTSEAYVAMPDWEAAYIDPKEEAAATALKEEDRLEEEAKARQADRMDLSDELMMGESEDDTNELRAEDALKTRVGLWRRRRRGKGFFKSIGKTFKKVGKAIVKVAKKVGKVIVKVAKAVGNAVLAGLRKLFNALKRPFDILKAATMGFIQIVRSIARGNLFKFCGAKYQAKVGLKVAPELKIRLQAVILGKNFDLRLHFHFRNIGRSIGHFFKGLWPAVKKLFRGKEEESMARQYRLRMSLSRKRLEMDRLDQVDTLGENDKLGTEASAGHKASWGKCNFPLPPMYVVTKKKQKTKKFKGDQKYLACMKKKPPKKTRMSTSGNEARAEQKARAAKERADKANKQMSFKCRREYKKRVAEDERWAKKRL